ncbi:helix-turn-helix transcriptional regulator [Clostridium sp. D43t1_170807_H7]|uniref:helix-turn-helix transcriptional regulator n=1 Tax=Clostridium sp. D43t1_170807_H7 TaxID=2787140 RepID=UPI001FAB936F|nr:helix-turn-helix transcriptional regulator [Clostridium sp. D43t1_170807_H7]
MSYALGVRIKELRTMRKISQEQMAEALDTTRQRYSRLENGQIDISFVMIKNIAKVLGVAINEITSAEEERKGLTTLFREKNNSPEATESVSKIEEILKVFHAHEKLYYQMRVRDGLED